MSLGSSANKFESLSRCTKYAEHFAPGEWRRDKRFMDANFQSARTIQSTDTQTSNAVDFDDETGGGPWFERHNQFGSYAIILLKESLGSHYMDKTEIEGKVTSSS